MVVQHPSFKAPEELLIFTMRVVGMILPTETIHVSTMEPDGLLRYEHELTQYFSKTCGQTVLVDRE